MAALIQPTAMIVDNRVIQECRGVIRPRPVHSKEEEGMTGTAKKLVLISAAVVSALVVIISAAGPSEAGPSATCVNQLNTQIKQRNQKFNKTVADAVFHQCVNPKTGLYFDGKPYNLASGPAPSLAVCKKDIEDAVKETAAIKQLDGAISTKGNLCLALAKTEAISYVQTHNNCRVAPDSASTIQCKNLAAYKVCLTSLPY